MPVLSEADSKRWLAAHGVAFPEERLAGSAAEAVAAAQELGFPVVVKLGGAGLAHKSERGLVRLDLRSEAEVERAAAELLAAAGPEDGPVHLLVAPMIEGSRELIAGLHRDERFGMVVMLGVGGILAEAVEDVACRLVPIDLVDATEMIDGLAAQRLLGPCRGEPAVDRDALAGILLALSRAAETDPALVSADLNPLVISAGRPVPVDALVDRSPVEKAEGAHGDA